MIELRMQPGASAALALTQVKLIATRFPGEEELTITVEGTERRIRLGDVWLYDGSSEACLSALAEFGEVERHVGR